MPAKRILLLGGTTEAREIAARLVDLRQDVVTSLAGVTTDPVVPVGRVRIGGFGGVDGLVDYIGTERIDIMVDATHPFAAQISAHAVAAAVQAKVRLLRFERPQWMAEKGDNWTEVPDMESGVATLPDGARVFVSTGRKNLAMLFARHELKGAIRAIEALDQPVPNRWTVVRERPPFSFQHEMQMLKQFAITHILTKNAGGAAVATKLLAARQLRLPVVMIQRPAKAATISVPTVDMLLAELFRTS